MTLDDDTIRKIKDISLFGEVFKFILILKPRVDFMKIFMIC